MEETIIQEKINSMKENIDEQFERLQEYLNQEDDLGKLTRYLITTERNPYNIINDGYSLENISDFISFISELNHSLYDDGDITFYTVNGAPRFSLKYNFSENDYLSSFEKTLLENNITFYKNFPDMKDFKLYECEELPRDIDSWIRLSEEYHKADIKKCFISDYDNNERVILHYKRYKCFEESWIEEAKAKN
jgi:hypothetical protein